MLFNKLWGFLQDIVLSSENIIIFIIALSPENCQGNCGIWSLYHRQDTREQDSAAAETQTLCIAFTWAH